MFHLNILKDRSKRWSINNGDMHISCTAELTFCLQLNRTIQLVTSLEPEQQGGELPSYSTVDIEIAS